MTMEQLPTMGNGHANFGGKGRSLNMDVTVHDEGLMTMEVLMIIGVLANDRKGWLTTKGRS
jgi:hypothetical protein